MSCLPGRSLLSLRGLFLSEHDGWTEDKDCVQAVGLSDVRVRPVLTSNTIASNPVLNISTYVLLHIPGGPLLSDGWYHMYVCLLADSQGVWL